MNKDWMAASATLIIDGVESHQLGVFSKNADSNRKHDTICLVSPVEKITEVDIDRAFLIAAAPDLLEAAKEALERLEREEFDTKCVDTLKEAISKAHGIEGSV